MLTPLFRGAVSPPLLHARAAQLFLQNYLLANYEGPESSYWVHISLTLISEWMAASLVSWLAFKHADCWASLDSLFMIKKKKEREKGKEKIPKHKTNPPQTFLTCYWANFPSLLFYKLNLWKQKHVSSTLCQEKQIGSLDFISKATVQRSLDSS